MESTKILLHGDLEDFARIRCHEITTFMVHAVLALILSSWKVTFIAALTTTIDCTYSKPHKKMQVIKGATFIIMSLQS